MPESIFAEQKAIINNQKRDNSEVLARFIEKFTGVKRKAKGN